MNIALLTAAGTGSRMGQDIPKQFLNIYDKPVIIYTLEAFQNHPNIDAIVVVCLQGWHEILKAYCKQFGITKLVAVVDGGATGQESIHNGIVEIAKNYSPDDIVLIHDGNRAMVSSEIISDAISVCKRKGNAVPVIPCMEAMVKTTDSESSGEQIARDDLRRTQTPHAFPLGRIIWAHEEAAKRGISNSVATCSLFIDLGEPIYFSHGSEKNFKITTMDDIELFKAMLNSKKSAWEK